MAKPQTLIIDLSGKAGLAPTFAGDINRAQSDPNLRYTGQDNQFVDGIFNTYKKDGYLSPSNVTYKRITPTGNQANYGSVPRVFNYFSPLTTSETYMLAGERFWQASGDSFTTLSSDATDINDGSEMYPMDMVNYYLNSSIAYPMFLSGDTSFGTAKFRRYDTSADTYTTIKSITSSDEYASLVLTDNGYLYVLNNNHVDKFDGTSNGGASGTYTDNVLVFPGQFRTRGGIDYRGNIYMGLVAFESSSMRDASYRQNEITKSTTPLLVGVYVWDRLSTVVKMRDFFQLPNMQNISGFHVAPNGALRLFGITNRRTTQLLEFTGTNFKIIYELGARAYPAQPKGVGVSGLSTYWLGQDGIYYCFGSTNFTDKESLTKLLDLNTVATAINGSTAIVNIAGATLISGYYNTGQSDTTNRLDHEAHLIGFQYTGTVAQTVTITLASPGVFTKTAHGLSIGDTIVFSTTGALPTGLTAGTTYYVISAGLTADTFEVSATLGGSAVNTSVSQSGVHSFVRSRINEVIRYFPHTNEVLQSVTPTADQGNVYTKVHLLPQLSTVKNITIYCAPGASTGSTVVATLKFYANQSTSTFKSFSVTRDMISRGYVQVELNKPYMNAFQMEIEWSTSQALGTNDFCPSYGVVEYEPISATVPK